MTDNSCHPMDRVGVSRNTPHNESSGNALLETRGVGNVAMCWSLRKAGNMLTRVSTIFMQRIDHGRPPSRLNVLLAALMSKTGHIAFRN